MHGACPRSQAFPITTGLCDCPYVKATSSSRSGLYQLLKVTWIGEGGTGGADMRLAFGWLEPSAGNQLAGAKTFAEKNAASLRGKKIATYKALLYAAHFFGAGTGAKVIAADVDEIAGKGATKASFSMLHGKTGEWAR